jgi:hypothetical protein
VLPLLPCRWHPLSISAAPASLETGDGFVLRRQWCTADYYVDVAEITSRGFDVREHRLLRTRTANNTAPAALRDDVVASLSATKPAVALLTYRTDWQSSDEQLHRQARQALLFNRFFDFKN